MTRHFGRKGHRPSGTVNLSAKSVADFPPIVMPKPDMNARNKLTLKRDQTAGSGSVPTGSATTPPPESDAQG